MSELSTGKVPWDLIARHLRGITGDDVVLGPAAGEDAALVEIGGELWAVASDPISFTAADAGRLAVIVNANDVAVMGAEPRFFLAVLLIAPAEATTAKVAELLRQIRATCESLGVALIGGHSEVTPGLEHSLVVGTMLGRVKGRPLRSGGLLVRDRIGMTKWAGLEGTAILMAEYGDRLRSIHGADAFRELRRNTLSEDWLSVVPEATRSAGVAGVHALHDVTEGGVGEALHELARASGVEIEVEAGDVPMLDATRILARDFGMDPLGLIGSGSLLVGCADDAAGELDAACAEAGIPFTWIGRVTGTNPDGGRSNLPRFPRDEILKAQLLADLGAVIFDMDGTLVDSHYDWPAIRGELGIDAPSLIDALNGLEGEEREAKWRRMVEIERQATAQASLQDGAAELLAFLRKRGTPTALVTNNTAENTASLLERFDLAFDLVLTRDDGLWKPSGAPVAEAIRRLGVPAERCLKVGDSHYDVAAARDAGCGGLIILHDHAGKLEADLKFPDAGALLRYLRLVL